MKRKAALVLAAALAFSLLGSCGSGDGNGETAGGPVENTGETYTWKLGTIYNDPSANPDYNSFGFAVQEFCDLVEERTNGQVIVEPYYSSVLGGSEELWGSLRNNEIQVFYGQPMSTSDERFGAWNIPYLFSDYEQVQDLIANPEAPLFQLAQEWMEEDRVHLVAVGSGVFRGFFNISHEVGSIEDVRDLKCRSYEDRIVQTFWGDICNATSMAFSEVYTGMQTGAIDGLEFAATSVLSSRYYEIATPSYYSDIDWQWTSGCNLVVSGNAWNELPDDLKAIVEECAWEAQDYFHEMETANSETALADLESHGTIIHHLTDEERHTWIDHARSMDDAFMAEIGEETWNDVWGAIDSYSAEE